jgi:hypothetical protein
MISSFAATLAAQPAVTLFRYTMGVLPTSAVTSAATPSSLAGAAPAAAAAGLSTCATLQAARLPRLLLLLAVLLHVLLLGTAGVTQAMLRCDAAAGAAACIKQMTDIGNHRIHGMSQLVAGATSSSSNVVVVAAAAAALAAAHGRENRTALIHSKPVSELHEPCVCELIFPTWCSLDCSMVPGMVCDRTSTLVIRNLVSLNNVISL